MNLRTPDPLRWCRLRWQRARRLHDPAADLMALATVAKDGGAAVRVLLLKHLDASGLGFVTNAQGPKVAQWTAHPIVEACLWWGTQGIQARFRGTIALMAPTELEVLWSPRPRDAKLVYHMGITQSAPIPSPATLTAQFKRTARQWRQCDDIPRAPNYQGYRLVPTQIELFHHSTIRLNQRIRYTRTKSGWKHQWLAP